MNSNLEDNLLSSLADNSLELATDIGELTIDNFIDDEFLKDIPAFSILYKGVKMVSGIREAFFAMKIYKFLQDFKSIPDHEKESLVEKIARGKKEKIKVGQTLLMVLDRIDDIDKTQIVANLFHAYLNSFISLSEFIHLNSILQQSYINHLKEFCEIEELNKLGIEIQSSLSALGLMLPIIMDSQTMYGDRYEVDKNNYFIVYAITKIGQKMKKYGYMASR